jgi:hypothetical protein
MKNSKNKNDDVKIETQTFADWIMDLPIRTFLGVVTLLAFILWCFCIIFVIIYVKYY